MGAQLLPEQRALDGALYRAPSPLSSMVGTQLHPLFRVPPV